MRDRIRCNSRGILPQPLATRAISQWASNLEWRHAVTLHILVGKICISFFLFYWEGMPSLVVLWLCEPIIGPKIDTKILQMAMQKISCAQVLLFHASMGWCVILLSLCYRIGLYSYHMCPNLPALYMSDLQNRFKSHWNWINSIANKHIIALCDFMLEKF